jgi:hypothetical protein
VLVHIRHRRQTLQLRPRRVHDAAQQLVDHAVRLRQRVDAALRVHVVARRLHLQRVVQPFPRNVVPELLAAEALLDVGDARVVHHDLTRRRDVVKTIGESPTATIAGAAATTIPATTWAAALIAREGEMGQQRRGCMVRNRR